MFVNTYLEIRKFFGILLQNIDNGTIQMMFLFGIRNITEALHYDDVVETNKVVSEKEQILMNSN